MMDRLQSTLQALEKRLDGIRTLRDVHRHFEFGLYMGSVEALRETRLISINEWKRLCDLGRSAFNDSSAYDVAEPFLGKPQAVEPAHELVELPATDPRPRLHLLCLLEPHLGSAGVCPAPVATVHPLPPYAGVHGRWRLGSGRRRMADGFVYVPCGAWFYLREAHAAPAAPEVLARCVRQRAGGALRADPRTVRTGVTA